MLLLAATPLDAVVAEEPILSARLLAPIPQAAAIAIEPLDDSDRNLRLRDEIAAALVAQQRAVATDGALKLRFATEILSDVRPRGSGTRGPRPSRPIITRPLRGGLSPDLEPPSGPAHPPRPNPVQYRLRATLEQGDGAVLWQGEAAGGLVGNNETALWSALAGAVVGAFGRTNDSRTPAGTTP